MKDSQAGVSCPLIFQADFNWSAWVGLPFELLGRGPEAYDCWGLVRAVLGHAGGVLLPSFLDYDDAEINGQGTKVIAEKKTLDFWVPIFGAEFLEPFDVLIFTIGLDPHHVGIYCGNGDFLHIQRNEESQIERLHSRRWRHRLEGAYRYHQ